MTQVENQSEIVVHAHGDSPESVSIQLVQSLLGNLGSDGGQRDSASVAPLQASGATLNEMLDALIRDFLETVNSSPTQIVDAELSHVMTTGEGLRAWGYVWLGNEASIGRSLSIKDHLELFTLETGGFELRVAILALGSPHERATSAAAKPGR